MPPSERHICHVCGTFTSRVTHLAGVPTCIACRRAAFDICAVCRVRDTQVNRVASFAGVAICANCRLTMNGRATGKHAHRVMVRTDWSALEMRVMASMSASTTAEQEPATVKAPYSEYRPEKRVRMSKDVWKRIPKTVWERLTEDDPV